jgi:hypothetical protein
MMLFFVLFTVMITSLEAEHYTFSQLIKPRRAQDMISFVQLLPNDLLLIGDRKNRIEILDLKNGESINEKSIECGMSLLGHPIKVVLEELHDSSVNLIILNLFSDHQYFYLIPGIETSIPQSKYIKESKPSEEQKQMVLDAPNIPDDEHGSWLPDRDAVMNKREAIKASLNMESLIQAGREGNIKNFDLFCLEDPTIYSFHKTGTVLFLGHDTMISVWNLTQ